MAISSFGDNGDKDDKEFEQKMVRHFEEEEYKHKHHTHFKKKEKIRVTLKTGERQNHSTVKLDVESEMGS